jgi:hypothetical protein
MNCAGLVPNFPDVCPLRTWDYRHEPQWNPPMPSFQIAREGETETETETETERDSTKETNSGKQLLHPQFTRDPGSQGEHKSDPRHHCHCAETAQGFTPREGRRKPEQPGNFILGPPHT